MKYAKDNSKHWLPRVVDRYKNSEFYVRVSYQNKQSWVKLGTGNKTEAASRAAVVWQALCKTNGDWVQAREAVGGPRVSQRGSVTVGEWIEAFSESAQLDQRTVTMYAGCLRRIAARIQKITHEAYPRRSEWADKVNAIPLSKITTAAVTNYIRESLKDVPREKVDKARSSVYGCLRNARNLFSAKRLKLVNLPAPSPLPFAGIDIQPWKARRYHGGINIGMILLAAEKELPTPQRTAVVLAACCGLRKEEADRLQWSQVYLAGPAPYVEIKTTDCFRPKSASSHRCIPLAQEVVGFLVEVFKGTNGPFVLPGRLPVPSKHRVYRCDPLWRALGKWLRNQGVTDTQPYHTLRKEFGSAVNAQGGLHATMEMLGHSDISVASSTYVVTRQRITVGFGSG